MVYFSFVSISNIGFQFLLDHAKSMQNCLVTGHFKNEDVTKLPKYFIKVQLGPKLCIPIQNSD